jgi:hypothetical protein
VIVVVLHGVLLWRQRIDYLCFLPQGKEEKSPSIRAKTTAIAYNALTPIYARLAALNRA